MQTSADAVAIHNTALSGIAVQNLAVNRWVFDDWRLRGFVQRASPPTWVAPTAGYSIVSTAYGDYIKKGAIAWDLGYQDLGHHTPVTLPDGVTTDTPYISSIAISGSEDLICFYANHFRNGFESGIYVMRVVDDGVNIYWGDPVRIFESQAIDDTNSQSQMFVSFPRLQTFNGEYWITALECSLQGTVITYHLCYFRSVDGLKWSDRQYIAGTSSDQSQAGIGINGYTDNVGNPAFFYLTDLIHAYLQVSGTNLWLVSKIGVSTACPATSLVGVTNSDTLIDLTPYAPSWSVTQPAVPALVTSTLTLENAGTVLSGNPHLVSGGKVIQKVGYGTKLLTLNTFIAEEVHRPEELGKDGIVINLSDYGVLTRDWVSDLYWEWFSPVQMTFDTFCDGTAFTPLNGTFTIGTDAELVAYAVETNQPYPDNMAIIHQRRGTDGSLELQWKITVSLTDHYAGIVLQNRYPNENSDFWSVYFDGNDNKYKLRRAIPSNTAYQYFAYQSPVQASSAMGLSADTFYWMKLTQWHNRVIVEHSTDRANWSAVIDYTSPLDGTNAVLSADLQNMGLLGRSTGFLSDALGNTDGSGGAEAMDDGSGNRVYWAKKITTGSYLSEIRGLAFLAGQTGLPSNLNVGVAKDNAGAMSDITISSNVLWLGSIPSSYFGDPSTPTWASASPQVLVNIPASTSVWLFFYFDTALLAGQEWNFFTDNTTSATMQISSDGVTWSGSLKSAAIALFVNYDLGSAHFGSMYYTTAETPKTIEDVSTEISALSGVIHSREDSFLETADLVPGTSFPASYWQPLANGWINNFSLDVDFVGSAAPVIFCHSNNIDNDYLGNVSITLDFGAQEIVLYNSNTTTTITIHPLVVIPESFHLKLVSWNQFYYVYINGALAGVLYDSDLLSDTPGWIGLNPSGGTFSNFRIPDMTAIKDYYVLDADKTSQSGLDDLISRVQSTHRYAYYFFDYDGAARISSFPRRTSVASYAATLTKDEGNNSLHYSLTEVQPQGNRYATHYDAQELDRTGYRRRAHMDYTEAFTNQSAYDDAEPVLTHAKELAETFTMELMPSDYALQREDRITANGNDYIVNDQSFSGKLGEDKQKVGLRIFIPAFIPVPSGGPS